MGQPESQRQVRIALGIVTDFLGGDRDQPPELGDSELRRVIEGDELSDPELVFGLLHNTSNWLLRTLKAQGQLIEGVLFAIGRQVA